MIGKSLLHYEVTDTIGSGAMGQVYCAHDTKLGRDVAIKLLPASLRARPEALQRFQREAQSLTALRRAKLLAARITIALGTADHELALSSASELDGISSDFKCPAVRAHVLLGRGSVALERGNYLDASAKLREAWTTFNKIDFTYDASRARSLLATADVNCSRGFTSADIIYLVNYVFEAGPPPCDVCDIWQDPWTCP